MRYLLTTLIYASFLTPASAQKDVLNDSTVSALIQQSQELTKKETDKLFVIYMYDKYKEFIVYKDAPYKGLSFELNNVFIQNELFNQVTFGLGAFTWDFKNGKTQKVGGILFDRPIYMGWDFIIYNQIQLTAGTTLFEKRYRTDQSQKTVLINSFIGLTGKFILGNKVRARNN